MVNWILDSPVTISREAFVSFGKAFQNITKVILSIVDVDYKWIDNSFLEFGLISANLYQRNEIGLIITVEAIASFNNISSV